VDATYYSPAWTSELRTMVHIIDGKLQVYSSLLYDGPTINCVFNGLYEVAYDYHSNLATKARIDAFTAAERSNGPRAHILPPKWQGYWSGDMEVYDAHQQPLGTNQVRIDYRPLTLLRAEQTVEVSGIVNRKFTFHRYRNSHRHTYEGPDVYGNAIGYGRALYTTQHLHGEAWKIRAREFLIDEDYTISAVWEWHKSNKLCYMTFGVLRWTPVAEVLGPRLAT
jgi:hypothetical protein